MDFCQNASRRVKVLQAKSRRSITDCFRLRHQAYCEGECPLEPYQYDGLERDSWDEYAVHALALLDGDPYATMRLVPSVSRGGELLLPMLEHCKVASEVPLPKAVEFSRWACPKREAANEPVQRHAANLQSYVRARLLILLISSGVEMGRTYGMFLAEPKLPKCLMRLGIVLNQIGEEVPFKGVRAPFGLSLDALLAQVAECDSGLLYLLRPGEMPNVAD